MKNGYGPTVGRGTGGILTMGRTVYRGARTEDLSELGDLINRMHSETVWGDDPAFVYDKRKMMRTMYGFVVNQPETIADVAVVDGRIVGLILGEYGTMVFNDTRQAREKLIYVDKSFRGGIMGPRLMKRFINWAHTVGAREIVGGANAGISAERTAKLWAKLGLTPFGYTVRARI